MARRFLGFAAAAAVVVLASACQESVPSAPQAEGPSFKPVPSANACLFTGNPSLSNSANAYFQTTADRKAASDLIALMQAGYTASGPAGATDPGYSLLALAGAASRVASRAGPVDVGETMAKQDINCMFNTDDAINFAGWPDDAQYDFSAALDAPHGGAFFVRGKANVDPATAPAVGNVASLNTISNPTGGNVSAIAPPSTPSQLTWPSILANKRTLIYGEPVTNGFDWKLIGRNTPFSPFAVVALCQGAHPGVDLYAAADVVLQKGVGTLGHEDGEALCDTPLPFALGAWRQDGLLLASRFLGVADRLLGPEPLHAAALLATKTITGGVSGAKGDQFVPLNLPTVVLKFTVPKTKVATTVLSGRVSATVNVTTPDGQPAGGIIVRLTSSTNNGTGTAVFEVTPAGIAANYTGCNPSATVPDPDHPTVQVAAVVPPEETTLGTVGQNGESIPTNAVWTNNLCFTKTGAVQLVANSVADGNPSAGAGTAISVKLSVNP